MYDSRFFRLSAALKPLPPPGFGLVDAPAAPSTVRLRLRSEAPPIDPAREPLYPLEGGRGNCWCLELSDVGWPPEGDVVVVFVEGWAG